MNGQAAKISVDEFMADYKAGAKVLPKEVPPVSEKMSVDEFMADYKAGISAKEPIEEPMAALIPTQEQPPTMLERGKEAVADFFRPSFAPEPTVPAGMEGMPESAIPAGMPEDIPGRRAEISERLGQINAEAITDSIDSLQTQIEELSSQAVDGALSPDLYEQYTALRPQYEQAIEDYNARVTEAQGLTGELEDLKQMEYGAEMTRPISTITGEPVPTPEEEAAGGRAAMAIIPYGFASAVRGMVPGALERAVMDPLTKTIVGKKYVSPIDEALKIGKYLPEAGQMAIGAPAHMAGAIVPLSVSFKTAGAIMKAVGLPPDLVLRTGPVMDRITAHVARGGIAGAVYGGLEAGTPKGMAEDAAFFGALEGGLGAVGGIFRKIFSANWYRNLEVKERGLVVQSLDDMLAKGYSEGEILKQWNNPMWREEALARRAVGEPPAPAAPGLSETQRNLAKEVIREKMAERPPVPAIPEEPIPFAPPGMPPPVGPPPAGPAPGVLPPGQGFGLVEPTPEVKLRPAPPTYPPGAEYVTGRPAPEELIVEHKPILSTRGLPWKEEGNALKALRSREDVSPATHKVVKVKKGYGIVKKTVETAEDRKKTDEAFERVDKLIREKYPKEAPPVPDVFAKTKIGAKVQKSKTFLSFVRAMGGIKDATLPGEIRALSPKETGVVGLTTSIPDKGLGFDEMAAAAVEHGWLPENLEDESGAFSEMLRDDIFAQKEKKPRIERLADVAEKTEREERWKEFEQAEVAELEYFAKHPDEEIDADLDQWQREVVAEIRRRNEADRARKIEENIAGKVEAENPDLEGLKKDEGFPEYIEGWDEKDLLDEEALAELEAWRAGEEVEKPEVEAPPVAEVPTSPFLYQDTIPEKIVKRNWDKGNSPRFVLEGAGDIIREFTKKTPSFSYIKEKLRRIDQYLTEFEEGTLHSDDSIEAAQKYASKDLEELIDAYEKQPTETEEQGLGKSLVLALAKGKNAWARKLHNKLVAATEAVPEKKPVAKPPMSSELKELHEHKARTLGFEKAGGSFVEGYLKKLAKVAEKTDMSAATAAYEALSEYKKGNINQASLEAEKILGKLHKAEKEVVEKPPVKPKPKEPIAEPPAKEPWEMEKEELFSEEAKDASKAKIFYRSSTAGTELGINLRGNGIFFGSDIGLVSTFGKLGEPSTIHVARIKYKNPYYMDWLEIENYGGKGLAKLIPELKKQGYDAIVENNENLPEEDYQIPWQVAVFDKSQITQIGKVENPQGRQTYAPDLKKKIHKELVEQALKSGKLTPEKYAELHEKDYGPLEEFMPEMVEKLKPEIIPEAEKEPVLREAEAPAEIKSRLLENIKSEKGSSELINDLSRLGADIMKRGHTTYKAFTAEMKTELSSVWEKIKSLIRKAYFAAKKIIATVKRWNEKPDTWEVYDKENGEIVDVFKPGENKIDHADIDILLGIDKRWGIRKAKKIPVEMLPRIIKSERGAVELGKPKPRPEVGREVISKDGTTVDWDKSKVITKEKVTRTCYATYNKDGSFKKWRTREAINKIKALKKAEVKYKKRLEKTKEKFDVRVEKIKTAKEILERRREKIKAIKDHFLLSDSDLRKITKKDIRLMSNFEFKQFIDDIRIKAERFAERRQALNELELLRKEKAFIAENNIRIFHKLPTIKKMTTGQLTTYAEILSGYEKGDQFLTPKRVKGLESTPWSGSKTMREVLEKASKEFDVPLSELKGIRVDEIDRFRYDTSLARQNPFYNFMVDEINTAAIRNQFKYFKEREKLYRLAKAALKSRKRGIIGRLVPRQKELMKYMEAEGDAKIAAATELTTEEMTLADAIEDFYRRAYNWLLINQELKSSRFLDSKYVFHSKRPLSELLIDLKDTGIRSAAKDLLNRWRLDEAQFKILDSKTGEILRMKKFFRQTLYRTGELTPTKNVIKATDIYMQQFFKKMALDESVPAIETLVMALRPKEKTPTGIFLNDSLMKFVKEYLNSKKGRALNIGIQQGGKIDTVIRFVNQMISLRYIALNIPLEVAAIVGETTAKLPALGNRKLILANMRRHTPRGRRILEKYKAFTGEGPFEEVLQPARNIGENINILLYGLFKWSRKVTKQDILLGNMTRAEFVAETIDPKKLAEATKMAGRWLDIEGSKSVLGTTSTGAAITKFKGWAIPIVSSTMHDATALARTLTRLGNPKKRLTQQQFRELYRIAEMGAILLAVMSLGIDEDKDTFAGRLKYYAIRELGTLYNALTPRTMLTAGVTIAFLEKLSQNLYLLMTLEKYKTRDELKGAAALKKQLTPAAISQFKGKKKPEPKVKKGRLKGGLAGGRLKSRLK